MKMTNEERQALIDFIKSELACWNSEGEYHQVLRVASAALTAEPYCHAIERPSNGELVVLNAPRKGTFPLFRYAPTELAVKLPKEKYIDVENDSMDDVSLAEDMGYNRCLADIRRLNAIDNTAQQYEALAGWKMVPVEPSKEMRSQIHPIADGNCSHCGNRTTLDCEENMLLSWRDMLEAAPKPEA